MMKRNRPRAFVIEAMEQPLSAVQFHGNIPGLIRYLFCSDSLHQSAPAHIAVHTFTGRRKVAKSGSFEYSQPHAHNCWEFDVLIPEGRGFLFQFETEEGVQLIRRASSLIIPPGVVHRMEILRGRGKMICVVLAENYANSLIRPK